MSSAAAFRMRVRVSAVRSAWVRRRAVGSARRADFCESAKRSGLRMLDLDLDLSVDDGDRIGLQRNLAGHSGRFARRDVEGAEVKRALHGLASDDAFLRQRRLTMGACVGGDIDRATN